MVFRHRILYLKRKSGNFYANHVYRIHLMLLLAGYTFFMSATILMIRYYINDSNDLNVLFQIVRSSIDHHSEMRNQKKKNIWTILSQFSARLSACKSMSSSSSANSQTLVFMNSFPICGLWIECKHRLNMMRIWYASSKTVVMNLWCVLCFITSVEFDKWFWCINRQIKITHLHFIDKLVLKHKVLSVWVAFKRHQQFVGCFLLTTQRKIVEMRNNGM